MNVSEFVTPVDDRYFEDYVPGAVHQFGDIKVDQAEIISFAKRFDPQISTQIQKPRNRPFTGV